jgi:hypothetical protein
MAFAPGAALRPLESQRNVALPVSSRVVVESIVEGRRGDAKHDDLITSFANASKSARNEGDYRIERMADIFLSASQRDRIPAEQVERALVGVGWEVWWAGGLFDLHLKEDIQAELNIAKCIVVLWSKHSMQSPRVQAEAADADARKILVQATLDGSDPPVALRSVPVVNLADLWRDGAREDLASSSAFHELTACIRSLLDTDATTALDRPRSAAPPVEQPTQLEGSRSEQRPPMSAVFLCYRREDSAGDTGRLHDRLTAIYGEDAVFIDIDSVPVGVDFVDHINEQLTACAVMLVVIGKSWVVATDGKGRRRIDRADDLVRAEIAEALRRKIPIIPVLVQNASMPDSDELPDDIRAFARRHAVEVSHARWHSDVQRLVDAIKRFMPQVGTNRS